MVALDEMPTELGSASLASQGPTSAPSGGPLSIMTMTDGSSYADGGGGGSLFASGGGGGGQPQPLSLLPPPSPAAQLLGLPPDPRGMVRHPSVMAAVWCGSLRCAWLSAWFVRV
jgi:hypothetical protein